VISPRYSAAVLILAGLALVPTIIHSYEGVVVDDGRKAAAVPESLAGFTSTPSGRNATWGKRRFDSDDWMERKYSGGGHEVTLTVVRAYDLKALYHHPELAVAYHEGHTFERQETLRLSQRPDVPVHVVRSAAPDPAVSMYVLHYDGAYIDNPITFQLRTAFELLFSGRKPMTLIYAQDASPQSDLATAPVTNLLIAAVSGFDSQSR
jgi:hypothetical protein